MLKEKLQADQLSSLKSGDKKTLEVLRYILAQVKNKEIEKREPLTDEETIQILRKQVKQLQESVDAFTKGGRNDLVEEYTAQQKIVEQYLPAEMSDTQLTEEIKKIIDANKEIAARDPKIIIGLCMKELRSKVDPTRIMKTLSSLQA